jgi:hypothetical protein
MCCAKISASHHEFALAAIKEFVDSLRLAVALEILLAVAVGTFAWLR